MSAPVRWILRMGGLPADKAGGITDLQTTAEQDTTSRPLPEFSSPSSTFARKTSLVPCNCSPAFAVTFPPIRSFPGKLLACRPHLSETQMKLRPFYSES